MKPAPSQADLTPSLVAALQGGDSAAAEILDRGFRGPLLRFCRGYLRDAGLAEDAVQELFAKVIGAAAVPDDFRVWIYAAARNHCLNALRALGRRKDRAALAGDENLAASMTGPLTGVARAERQAQIQKALSALSLEQREVLRLRYTEQLSRAEIGRVLCVPESTVKSRLFDAVRRLREHPALSPDG